jgi:polysaccharide biosynthesis protein
LIAFFLSSRDVGIYSLAGSFSNPIAILAIALNSVLFKAIANSNTISKKFLLINFVCVVLSFITINILSIVVINIFLNIPDYDGIYRFIFLISLSTAVTALYQPYNNWFVARGYGAELKKMNFIIIPIFLVANVILILFFGIFGAIFASISVNISYFILYTIYYRVILKNIDRDNKINYNIV